MSYQQSTVVDYEEGGTILGKVIEKDWKGNATKVVEIMTGRIYSVNDEGKFA